MTSDRKQSEGLLELRARPGHRDPGRGLGSVLNGLQVPRLPGDLFYSLPCVWLRSGGRGKGD